MSRIFPVFILVVVLAVPSWALEQTSARALVPELNLWLQPESLAMTGIRMPEAVSDFYRASDEGAAWTDGLSVGPQAHELLEVIRGAAEEGLCPEDYHLLELESLFRYEEDCRRHELTPAAEWLARLDIVLTDAFLLYATHQIQGRLDPVTLHNGWKASPRKADVAKLLRYALTTGRTGRVLAELAPTAPGYVRLREQLTALRLVAAEGLREPFPTGRTLRPGDVDPHIRLLKQRLFESGDLAGFDEANASILDRDTVTALRRWQVRHGLTSDGVLGPRTRTELRVPITVRIRQIERNLERWRWLPKSLGGRYILVNIADFALQVVEEGVPVMTMPVIVGTSYRKTPVFSGRMTYLEFAPYWYVPPTILREDKLPLIKVDPTWMERNHYEIIPASKETVRQLEVSEVDWKDIHAENFPGILRMKPGPWNPLGRVKFMFPNPYAVYLHDTPDRHLFMRSERSFSSGCIRIERPLDLAQYLLEGRGWNCDEIIDLLQGDHPLRVNLPEAIPVHLLYFTAWVDYAGTLHYRKDPYWRDLGLEDALQGFPEKTFSAEARTGF
ncbi:L,D-transpeptidase family protein [Desulfuromonas sp. AOP6]|uniref:L,D-transpeptidase family protein n=1 Tax=Desulfuromonas sp. AOP6 TaxID=1566351 RepID=UPI00126EE4E6|nr:L,D-transpeptidase family protein [Desulfuromonas sp. AOP6]BCA79197.1 murein L,D-transpeptidase [Desulfuromonas sp. AOP6]